MQLFGVIGKVSSLDKKKSIVKVEFDKETEEKKIHDPFFGQMCLMNQNNFVKKENIRRYYTD